jgi:beta-xylosidase
MGTMTRSTGEPLLDRQVTLRVEGLAAGAYEVRHLRVDLERSNIAAVWEAMSGGAVELAFDLLMPSVSLVELVPA